MTYLFQLEVRNTLVALCSTQLYTPHTTAYPGAHPFTEAIMQQVNLVPYGWFTACRLKQAAK